MSAYSSAVQTQSSAKVVELAAFRPSERPAAELPADAPPLQAGANVVSLFPEFRLRPTPIVRARRRVDTVESTDLVTACDLLVGNFRVLQEAVLALQESCREIEADADLSEIGTSGLMLGIAAVSSASETFQQELAATVDAAFR